MINSEFYSFSSAGDRVFYFLGELAEFQQNLLSYFSAMVTEKGFIPVAAPDFCKDFVIVRVIACLESSKNSTLWMYNVQI
jgi:seryl-tRNA synthetase